MLYGLKETLWGYRRQWLMGISWLVALGLVWVVVRVVPFSAVWQTIQQLQGGELAWLLLANGVVLWGLNGRWWFILRGLGHPVPYHTLLGYRLVAFGISYFTPGPHVGGEPAQVYLVERFHGVPRPVAVAAVGLDKTLELLVNFTFLLLGVGVMLRTAVFNQMVGTGTAVFAILLLLLPVTYLLALRHGRYPLAHTWLWLMRPGGGWLHRVYHLLHSSETQASHFCRVAPRFLFFALGMSLLSWLALLAEYGLMVSFLGSQLTLEQLLIALTAIRLAMLLPLPAGLGTLETSQLLAFAWLGGDTAVGLAVALSIRARDVWLGLAGLGWGAWKMGWFFSAKPVKVIE